MLGMSDGELCLSALHDIIDVVAKKWSLFVLNVLGNRGRLRFNQIMRELSGIGPTTLAETLEQLLRLKLIERQAYAEIPTRVEYSLTPEGEDLRSAIVPLLVWATKKDPARGRDPGCPEFARVPLSTCP